MSVNEPQASPNTQPTTREQPIPPSQPQQTQPQAQIEPFDTIKTRSDQMINELSARDGNFDQFERAYKLTPNAGTGDSDEGNTSAARARHLFDPHPKNAIDDIVASWTTNPISVSVPTTVPNAVSTPQAAEQSRNASVNSDLLEQACKALIYASDLVSQKSFISDSFYAAAIFGEVPQIIDNVLAEAEDPSRVEAPFVFEVQHPKMSYPRYSRRSGLYQHVFRLQTTLADIKSTYGAKRIEALGVTGNDDQLYYVRDYIDKYQHCVWLEEFADRALLQVPIPPQLGIIPRVSRIAISPGFFDKQEDRRMPFLYAYIKSKLWAARNVIFTVMYSNIVDFLNPKMVAKHAKGNAPLKKVDWGKRGDQYDVEEGEGYEPMPRQLLPPEVMAFSGLLEGFVEESTISKIRPSAKGTKNMPSSSIQLLASLAQVAGERIAQTVEMATAQTLTRTLKWIKAGDYRPVILSRYGHMQLMPSDIPDNFQVVVTLNPNKDMMRNAVAGLATTLSKGLNLGYDEIFRILEEGGIVESQAAALDHMIQRVMIDAFLPVLAKQSAATAQKLTGVISGIPTGGQPAPAATAPPGTMAPNAAAPLGGAIPQNVGETASTLNTEGAPNAPGTRGG